MAGIQFNRIQFNFYFIFRQEQIDITFCVTENEVRKIMSNEKNVQ